MTELVRRHGQHWIMYCCSIFLLGVYFVLRGRARLGVMVAAQAGGARVADHAQIELFGILNLFGNFIPSLLNLIKKLPVTTSVPCSLPFPLSSPALFPSPIPSSLGSTPIPKSPPLPTRLSPASP